MAILSTTRVTGLQSGTGRTKPPWNAMDSLWEFKIATVANGTLKWLIYLLKMVIFHSYVSPFTRGYFVVWRLSVSTLITFVYECNMSGIFPEISRHAKSGWWFGTFFTFPYIGNNHPN